MRRPGPGFWMGRRKECEMMQSRTLLLALVFSLSAAGYPAAATRTYSTETVNTITTGDISISLKEYELDDTGQRVPYVDGKLVVPGQRVDKIVTITNEAQDAWIRARVEYNTDDGLEGMSDDMLAGISGDWTKCGGYFYYTKPVSGAETVEFFRQVVVPREWDQSSAEKGFSIGVTAQAVQAANFTPDFSSREPWFGIPIETCIHDSHAIYQAESPAEFSVIFENGSEGFIRTGDNFFGNFPSMVPGDTLTDTLVVGNHFASGLEFYFYTDIPRQEEDSRQLLDQLQLTVQSGDTRIYEGPLGAETLRDGIRLGEPFGKGEVRTLTYSIHMPAALTNNSALRSARVRWIFQTRYQPPSGSSSGGSPSPERTKMVPGPVQELVTLPGYISVPLSGASDIARRMGEWMLPGTGDRSHGRILLLVFLVSAGAAGFLVLGKRKQKGSHKGSVSGKIQCSREKEKPYGNF